MKQATPLDSVNDSISSCRPKKQYDDLYKQQFNANQIMKKKSPPELQGDKKKLFRL